MPDLGSIHDSKPLRTLAVLAFEGDMGMYIKYNLQSAIYNQF